MKKIYQKPSVDILFIQTCQMIAESGPEIGGSTNNPDDLLSRDNNGSFFFDDDDEDY